MPAIVAYVLGVVAAIACTVLAFIFIVPEKKRAELNKFFQWVHDLCNFRSLLIEKILKALYIFSTAFCIVAGFFLLFSVQSIGWGYSVYMGLTGVLLLLLGPVLTRLIFEGIMMAVLQLKNTIAINDKLVAQPGSVAEQKAEEAAKKAEAEAAKKAEEAARAQYQQMQYAQQQYQQPYQPYGQTRQTPYVQPVQPQTQTPYVQPVQPQPDQPQQPDQTQQ